MHDFDTSFALSKGDEAEVDAYFGRWFSIEQATREQERCGIDRIWTDRKGRVFAVEYKADRRAAETGNLFIETESVDTARTPGWALTCQAQLVVVYVPGRREVFVLDTLRLKAALPDWMERFPRVEAVNRGYSTWGHAVPMDVVLGACCRRQHRLAPGPAAVAVAASPDSWGPAAMGAIRDDEIPM